MWPNRPKHGGAGTREYRIWKSMKSRCYNPSVKYYSYYGGRGITVCNSWLSNFEAFRDDMGPCPPGRSIDRIDTNGPYSPDNCRWATRQEQSANRSNRIVVEYEGAPYRLADLAKKVGKTYFTVHGWYKTGKLTVLD